VGVAIELCPLDPCDDDPPELCALELEPEPPELWPPPELAEELDPPEEPPCEPPLPPLEPPELPPPPPPEECCAKVTTERRRTAATQRLGSRIKHLVPTEPGRGCHGLFRTFRPRRRVLRNRVKERSNWVKKCYAERLSDSPNRSAFQWSSRDNATRAGRSNS
jgi:hypothetical protein